MKKLCFTIVLSALALTTVFAQISMQSLKWTLQGKEVDFTQYPPQANALTTGDIDFSVNSFTNSN